MASLFRASRVVLALKGSAAPTSLKQSGCLVNRQCLYVTKPVVPSSSQTLSLWSQVQSSRSYGQQAFESQDRDGHRGQDRDRSRRPSLNSRLDRLDQDMRRKGELHFMHINEVMGHAQKERFIQSSHAQMLIHCYGSSLVDVSPENRIKSLHELVDMLKAKGFSLEISHHNALLMVYLENNHPFCPIDYLASLGELSPNRITYQRLLTRYCQTGDIEGALKILSQIKDENLTISQSVFESLIMGHGRAGDLPAASEMLEHMASSGYEPSAHSYTLLAQAQAETGDMDAVRATLEKAEAAEQPLSDYHMLEVVFSFASKGHHDCVDQMITMFRRNAYYNMEAKLSIYKLLNHGFMETAEKIYSTMTPSAREQGSDNNLGLFYLRQMISCGRPVQEVLESSVAKACPNPQMLEMLLETALIRGQIATTATLMDAITAKGGELRTHYFWPPLVAAATRGLPEMMTVLRDMQRREVALDTKSFKDIILPRIFKISDLSDTQIVDVLKEQANIRPTLVFNELLRFLLFKNETRRAVALIEANRIWVHTNVALSITFAVENSQDYEAGAFMISQIRGPGQEIVEDVAGNYLVELARRGKDGVKAFDAEAAVKSAHAVGLSISLGSQEKFLSLLSAAPSAELESQLQEMASGDLELSNNMNNRPSSQSRDDSSRYLESRLAKLEGEGEKQVTGLQVLLLRKFIDERNEQKAEELWHKMSSDMIAANNAIGPQVSLLGLYTDTRNLEKAMTLLKEIQATASPDTCIDKVKIVKLAGLMVEHNMGEEALALLEAEGNKTVGDGKRQHDMGRSMEHFAVVLTNKVARTKDPALMKKFFACLVKHGYSKPTPRLLRAGVRMHLVSNEAMTENSAEQMEAEESKILDDSVDIDAGFKALLETAEQYGVLPYKNVFLRRLIRSEDKERLQELLDLSFKIHGESNSMLDLAVAFLEEDKIKQAIKVVQSPSIRFHHGVNQRFDFYLDHEDNIENMLKLLNLTAHMRGVDRRPFFSKMLQAYEKIGDWSSGLDLWSRMQEDNVTPTNQFLLELADVLKKHGQPVPFGEPRRPPLVELETDDVVPAETSSQTNKQASFTEQKSELKKAKKVEQVPLSESAQKLRDLLQEGKLDEAVEFYNSSAADLGKDALSLLTPLRVAGRLPEGTAILSALLAKPASVNIGSKFAAGKMLQALASDHQYTALRDLLVAQPSICTAFTSRLLCFAASTAEEREDCIGLLKTWPARLSVPGLCSLLANQPNFLEQVSELAPNLEKNGQSAQFHNMMWSHHFCLGDKETADKHIGEGKGAVDSLLAVTVMRQNKDLTIAPRLLELPEVMADTEACGEVYAAWAMQLAYQDKLTEAVQVVRAAHSVVESLPQGVLGALKKRCEEQGVEHNFHTAGDKRTKKEDSSSSSSSSDQK